MFFPILWCWLTIVSEGCWGSKHLLFTHLVCHHRTIENKKATQLQMWWSAQGMGTQKSVVSIGDDWRTGPLCSFWLAETNSELGNMIKLLEFTWTESALFTRVFCASFFLPFAISSLVQYFKTPILTGEVYKNCSMIVAFIKIL